MHAIIRRASGLLLSPASRGARRHGSAGGYVWALDEQIVASPFNKVSAHIKGNNPLGEDHVGFSGWLGKYIAFMVGLNVFLRMLPEPKAKSHGH